MRVVDRKTFLAMPPGTIYAKGEPWAFGNIQRKEDTLGDNDWWYQSFDWIESRDMGEANERLTLMLETGASFPMDNSIQRDGCFDPGEIFLIYEDADIERLTETLKQR